MPRVLKKRANYGSGSITELRPGVWRVRVRAEGARISRTVVGSEAAAVRLKKQILQEIGTGSYVQPSPTLFGEYLDEWLESAAKAKAPGTYKLYRRTADRWILPSIGRIPLQMLKPAHIKALFANLPDFSGSYKQQIYLVICGCLKSAEQEGLVKDNAASKMTKKPRREDGKVEAGASINCWTEEEAKRFLAVAQGYGPRQAAFYTLALDTGMRKGELAALQWSDVDWQRSAIRVKGSLSYVTGEPVIGPVKNRQSRRLVISDESLSLLKRLLIANPPPPGNDYIFLRATGKPLLINNLGDREFTKLQTLAKVKRLTLHGLRHTCATLLLSAGVPPNYVSERLGHKDPTITLKIYAHAIPSGEEFLIEKLRRALGFTGEPQAPQHGWKN